MIVRRDLDRLREIAVNEAYPLLERLEAAVERLEIINERLEININEEGANGA